MAKFIWSEVSKIRIFEIADYIAIDAPKAAELWVEKIFSKELVIKENPQIGRVVPEIGDLRVRELIVGEYRLLYSIEPHQILVLTVINCREQAYFNDGKN